MPAHTRKLLFCFVLGQSQDDLLQEACEGHEHRVDPGKGPQGELIAVGVLWRGRRPEPFLPACFCFCCRRRRCRGFRDTSLV